MTFTDTSAQVSTIPPLENGDKLTRAEFERRYEAMPNVKKAELIEGIVYMASPVRANKHGKPHSHIMTWLGTYEAATPGLETLDNTTVRLDADNEPQPDAILRIQQGGRSTISKDDYVEGAPELIVEIAASSASYDLHQKLKVYRRNEVQEYLVWRVYDRQFDWFKLQEGEYIQLEPNTDEIFCSQVFPGLWLDKSALLSLDLVKVLAVLQQGLSTPEHKSFVEKLSV
ncbi:MULTISPECIES: Uma2 family endonuclease [Nostoc]|uniref:Uma2 family endonuclease n=1 Tax=Nostoc paludosum FACHB-159 TaxID=2692908 RepID=A0ABR8K2H4_9NOSO|nr:MULTISPECIES: Uma2 family endonuclease [Nostoc]MBD2677575.1 Uma2 family endonuclease [Nostoc sp. FACHB-857]MBD2733622.1 Uma2 family endonuclease [Nostoc paludosum FACHB-159]